MPEQGNARGKSWWRLVAILTSVSVCVCLFFFLFFFFARFLHVFLVVVYCLCCLCCVLLCLCSKVCVFVFSGIGNVLFWTKYSQTFNVRLRFFGEPLVQVITLRGPFVLKNCSFFDSFLDEKHEVLSGGALFHRIGPRVSPDRTFSKTNAPILKKHTFFFSYLYMHMYMFKYTYMFMFLCHAHHIPHTPHHTTHINLWPPKEGELCVVQMCVRPCICSNVCVCLFICVCVDWCVCEHVCVR